MYANVLVVFYVGGGGRREWGGRAERVVLVRELYTQYKQMPLDYTSYVHT